MIRKDAVRVRACLDAGGNPKDLGIGGTGGTCWLVFLFTSQQDFILSFCVFRIFTQSSHISMTNCTTTELRKFFEPDTTAKAIKSRMDKVKVYAVQLRECITQDGDPMALNFGGGTC